MAWQLLYTSAPRLLDAGRTGFGTVARHRAVTGLLASSVERFSQFARLAGHDPKRVVYCHRVVIVGANKYHVLSCLRDAGSDYTGRTNHLAHHLIAEAREIAPLMAAGVTPVDVLQGMDWRTEWTEGARFLEPAEEIQLSLIRPQRPRVWKELTGSQEYARLPSGPEAQRAGCYLIAPPTVNILDLLGEALTEVSDQAWSTTFTTTLEPNDEVGDFRWIVLPASSPLRGVTEGSPRIVFDLTAPATLPAPPPRRVVAAPKIPKLPTPVPSDHLRPGASSRPEGPVSLPAPILAPVELPMHGRLRAAVPAGATLAGKKAILWSVTAVAVIFLFLLVYNLGRNQGVSVSTTSIPEEGGAANDIPINGLRDQMKQDARIREWPDDRAKQVELINAFEKWQDSRKRINEISKGAPSYMESPKIETDLARFDEEATAWKELTSHYKDASRSTGIKTEITTSFKKLQIAAIDICRKAQDASPEDEQKWLRIFKYDTENKQLFTGYSSPEFGEALTAWVSANGDEKEIAGTKLQKMPSWLQKKIAAPDKNSVKVLTTESAEDQDEEKYDWESNQHDVYILIIDTEIDDSLKKALTFVKHKLPEKMSGNTMIVGPLNGVYDGTMSSYLIPKEQGYGPREKSQPNELIKVHNNMISEVPKNFEYKTHDFKSRTLKYEDEGLRVRMRAQTKPCEILIVPTSILLADNAIWKSLGITEPKLDLVEEPNGSPANGRVYNVGTEKLLPERFKNDLSFSSLRSSGKRDIIKISNNQIRIEPDPKVQMKSKELSKLLSEIKDPINLSPQYLDDSDRKKLNDYIEKINDNKRLQKLAENDRVKSGGKEKSSNEELYKGEVLKWEKLKNELILKPLKLAEDESVKLKQYIDTAIETWEESALKTGYYQLRALVGGNEIPIGKVMVNLISAEKPK